MATKRKQIKTDIKIRNEAETKKNLKIQIKNLERAVAKIKKRNQ